MSAAHLSNLLDLHGHHIEGSEIENFVYFIVDTLLQITFRDQRYHDNFKEQVA